MAVSKLLCEEVSLYRKLTEMPWREINEVQSFFLKSSRKHS